MENGKLSREEALENSSCQHACHVLFYCDTNALLFERIPIKHIILMQMRFDGLLGFPGGFVNPQEETLEAGLSRELLEEVGVALPISVEDHVDACYAPSDSSQPLSSLITHFYVRKMDEEQIREMERASASTATDHGLEVLGMVRVPLYTMQGVRGLPSFLSHSFIGNARSQLVNFLLRLNLVAPEDLHNALTDSLKTHADTAHDLRAALALMQANRKRFESTPARAPATSSQTSS